MSAIADIFRRFAPVYLEQFGDHVPTAHRAVIRSILACRTESLGTLRYSCSGCDSTFDVYRSCGNRHCPTCGGAKSHAWLHKRIDRLLPVPHFMITFTIPAFSFRSLSTINGFVTTHSSKPRLRY